MYPEKRCKKWLAEHEKLLQLANNQTDLLLLGDSILFNLNRYPDTLGDTNLINFGLRGDRIQNLMYRIQYGLLPISRNVLILIGTNNIGKNNPQEIADGIISVSSMVKARLPQSKILIHGLLPRDASSSKYRKTVALVNHILKTITDTNYFIYIEPDLQQWTPNGCLNPNFYFKDGLHLIKGGYVYLNKVIKPLMKHTSPVNTLPTVPLSAVLKLSFGVSPKKQKVYKKHKRATTFTLKFIDNRDFDLL